MKSILVVEDSALVLKVIRHVLSQSPLIEVTYTQSFAEAREQIESGKAFFAALVDLSLPDAPDGEVVDFTLEHGIPTIVLTGSFDDDRRDALLNRGIVDYVTKEGRYSYELALQTLHRLIKNEGMRVLIVDDSSTQRTVLRQRLQRHLFDVLEAENGVEAIKTLIEQPDIQLLITDYNMPRMNGCELVKNLRIKYEKSDLVIIGVSSEEERSLSAKFIKQGANDFLKKPYNHEELFCRVNHNLEFLELIEKIRDASNRDEFTGVYNRQYFFRRGQALYDQTLERNKPVAAALIDLDHFSRVNEQYGHEVGDQLMYQIAQRLQDIFGRFLFARADGQTFYVLMPGLTNDQACEYVEKVRQIICAEDFVTESATVHLTFTAGVSNRGENGLDDVLAMAQRCLKRAKEAGGDLVFGD